MQAERVVNAEQASKRVMRKPGNAGGRSAATNRQRLGGKGPQFEGSVGRGEVEETGMSLQAPTKLQTLHAKAKEGCRAVYSHATARLSRFMQAAQAAGSGDDTIS